MVRKRLESPDGHLITQKAQRREIHWAFLYSDRVRPPALCFGDEPCRIRTCDTLLKRQVLYQAELTAQLIFCNYTHFHQKVNPRIHSRKTLPKWYSSLK